MTKKDYITLGDVLAGSWASEPGKLDKAATREG